MTDMHVSDVTGPVTASGGIVIPYGPPRSEAVSAPTTGAVDRDVSTAVSAALLPVLPAGTIAMMHGPRGVGLTHMMMGCAVALASGRAFLGWKASRPASVLLVTGAMPSMALEGRVREAMRRQHVGTLACPLRVVAPGSGTIAVPDIGTVSGREMLAGLAAQCDVVAIDDLASLLPTGRIDDEADFWHWLGAFRLAGKSVLVSQASGRTARRRCEPQAHALLQRTADVVIRLALPPGYRPTDGAHFEMHIDRARHLIGSQRMAQEVQLRTRKGVSAWLWMPIGTLQRRRFDLACIDGMSVAEAAKAVGISRATGYRWFQDLQKLTSGAEEHGDEPPASAEILAFERGRDGQRDDFPESRGNP